MKQRLVRLRSFLKKEKLSAFIAVVREGNSKNVSYLSGFGGTTGALVVTSRGAALSVDGRYTLRAREEARAVRIVPVALPRSKENDMSDYILPALRALYSSGVPRAVRIGFEGEHVSVLMARSWKKTLPGTLVPTAHAIERLRQVKDASEIRRLAAAGRRTSLAFRDAVPKIKAGMRESEVVAVIESALKKHGALAPSFPAIVASGPNAAIPHHRAGSRRLKAGESVVMDFGGLYPGGYVSDMTRTIFVPGENPSPQLVAIYGYVLEANRRAARAVQPGMVWKEYDAIARSYIREKGYGKYFAHGLGHSVGLEVHDPYDYRNDPIVEGAVITNEPGIYLPGVGGVRIEDMLVITQRGAKRLTTAPYLVIRQGHMLEVAVKAAKDGGEILLKYLRKPNLSARSKTTGVSLRTDLSERREAM